jgi:hypothetical protein
MSAIEAWAWTVGLVALILAVPLRSIVVALVAIVELPLALLLLV